MDSNYTNGEYSVADFFCGAGGFSEGFSRAGVNVIFSLDNWKLATETHLINLPNCECKHMNILGMDTTEKIDQIVPDTDIIIGSPPCVSFSNSNKSGKSDKTLGIKLITQFLKIILHKKTKPNSKLKYWILENVPNSIKFIKDEYTAKELGLSESLPNLVVKCKNILIASDYGSPQRRKRAIVGDYIIPKKTHINNEIKLIDILAALGPPLNNNKQVIVDPLFNIELNKADLTDHFYDSVIPKELWEKAKKLKTDHGYMGKMEFPDSFNRTSRTIMATESYCSRESIIFQCEDSSCNYRAPTIRELASIMGFPIDYQFKGSHGNKHKQIGNAVCVQLSSALANAILENDNVIRATPNKREVIKLDGEQKTKLFTTYKINPRKINAKFKMHIPYLKINQFRVELDNTESDFVTTFIWKSYLHKGSGKNALKTQASNSILEQYLTSPLLDKIKNSLFEHFSVNLDAKLFQEAHCLLSSNSHITPTEILEKIKEIIDTNILIDETIEIEDIFPKKLNYPIKILYGLYCVNYIVNKLN